MKRLAALFGALVAASAAPATVLFDAARKAKPNEAPWAWFYLSLPTAATVTPPGSDGFVTLDTSAHQHIQAGFGKQLPMPLDRKRGYSAEWRLRVVKEVHNADGQRAGLSVFVLGDDHRGIEVAYWQDRVFVYDDNKTFRPGEFAQLNTRRMRTYRLEVHGDTYELKVDGRVTLHGRLRDYSWFGFPYSRKNSIWYGDDTRRGRSASEWASFSVTADG